LHSFQDLTMAKKCVNVNVLLFGVTLMDAYQALRFSVYLNEWKRVNNAVYSDTISYSCNFKGKDFFLVLHSEKIELILMESDSRLDQDATLVLESYNDPTSWIVKKLCELSAIAT
jgi:hypothetical protein